MFLSAKDCTLEIPSTKDSIANVYVQRRQAAWSFEPTKQQHGFRSGCSCETQLINTVEHQARSVNDRNQTDLLILDFSKAFDKVAHKRLLLKLEYYGIRGLVLAWIKAWLIGRT